MSQPLDHLARGGVRNQDDGLSFRANRLERPQVGDLFFCDFAFGDVVDEDKVIRSSDQPDDRLSSVIGSIDVRNQPVREQGFEILGGTYDEGRYSLSGSGRRHGKEMLLAWGQFQFSRPETSLAPLGQRISASA